MVDAIHRHFFPHAPIAKMIAKVQRTPCYSMLFALSKTPLREMGNRYSHPPEIGLPVRTVSRKILLFSHNLFPPRCVSRYTFLWAIGLFISKLYKEPRGEPKIRDASGIWRAISRYIHVSSANDIRTFALWRISLAKDRPVVSWHEFYTYAR